MTRTERPNDCERYGDVTEGDRKFGSTDSGAVEGVVGSPRCCSPIHEEGVYKLLRVV